MRRHYKFIIKKI